MADFDDSVDPELGAACNRLASWVEPIPVGQIIDTASGLTERDLALILRNLHATRLHRAVPVISMDEAAARYGRPSVPLTKKDDTHDDQVKAMSDAALLAAYQRTTGEPGDVGADQLLAEIERRNLDI